MIGKSQLVTPNYRKETMPLVELYCDEVGCDCRRVFFNVLSEVRSIRTAV